MTRTDPGPARRARRLAATILLAAALPVAATALPGAVVPASARAAATSPAATSRPAGRIYYSDEARGDIISVRPDGRGRRNLTAAHGGRGSAHFPSPSADGRLVAFSRYPGRAGWRAGERGDLVVMRADGRRPRVLTRTPGIDERTPGFTADGRSIHHAQETGPHRYEIVRRPLHGGPPVLLTDLDRGVSEDPVASPDGRRIAFQTLDATRLMLARADGSELVELTHVMNGSCTDDCPGEEDPAFSPDSRLLAFSSRRSGSPEIWVAQVDGSGARRLTRVGDAVEPSWSPDGRHIAFERLEQGIWIIGRDGRGLRRVVSDRRATFPRWGRRVSRRPSMLPSDSSP